MTKKTSVFYSLYRKEILQLIFSQATLPAAAFLLFSASLSFLFGFPTITQYYQRLPMLMTVFIPLLASGSWANEHKTGTIQFMLTLPASELFLSAAKFTALLTVYLGILCCTLPVPLMLAPCAATGAAELFSIWMALILYGGAALAMALFFSNTFSNSVASFLITAAGLLILNTAHILAVSIELPKILHTILNFISFSRRYETMNRGIIDSRDLLFFLIPALGFLILDSACMRLRRNR